MKPIPTLAALIFLLVTFTTASANIARFSGKWKNVAPATRGLTVLSIVVKGPQIEIQAWGKCHPTDCPWGYAVGTAYGPEACTNLAENAEVILTRYVTSFSRSILIIRPIKDDQLQVEMMTRFTDQSGRTNYSRVERFSRVKETGVARLPSVADPSENSREQVRRSQTRLMVKKKARPETPVSSGPAFLALSDADSESFSNPGSRRRIH